MSFDENYPAAPQPSAPGAIRVQDAALPLYQAKGWLKFVAVLMIIVGALYALTIVGLIVAWLPIWMGVLLWKAADGVQQARDAGSAEQFILAQQKLKTYFTIMGVTALVSIVLVVLMFVLFGAAMMAGIQQGIQT
jgi:uncharacterized membrane protein